MMYPECCCFSIPPTLCTSGQHVFVCLSCFLQETGEIQAASVDNTAEPFRSALDKAMQSYVKEHYPDGIVTVSSFAVGIQSKMTLKSVYKMKHMVLVRIR